MKRRQFLKSAACAMGAGLLGALGFAKGLPNTDPGGSKVPPSAKSAIAVGADGENPRTYSIAWETSPTALRKDVYGVLRDPGVLFK